MNQGYPKTHDAASLGVGRITRPREAGASHILGPGTVIAEAAVELLEDLKGRLSGDEV